jgi:predicted PurR-regulated permease PerM
MKWFKSQFERDPVATLIVIIMFIVFVLACITVYAGDKEELQWKAKALISEAQLRQAQLQSANQAIMEFFKELDQKGFVYKDGIVMEKPKKVPEKKQEVPKSDKK